ncbi:MAG: 3'-5' exonuclease [Minisyncoccia bacterium]
MKFPKDIVIVDFEGSGDQPTQIGVVLLDKETLEEKDSFVSYISAVIEKPSKASGITQEMLVGAPTQAEVGKMIHQKFGTDFFFAYFVGDLDIRFFKLLINAAGVPFSEYDYHTIDIWSLAYFHLLKKGYTGGLRSEQIFQEFGAKPRGLHNALEDSRLTADVLRKIVL